MTDGQSPTPLAAAGGCWRAQAFSLQTWSIFVARAAGVPVGAEHPGARGPLRKVLGEKLKMSPNETLETLLITTSIHCNGLLS